MAQPSPLLELPAELLVNILDYINYIDDLKALCLTCKELSSLSCERLYKDIHLSMEQMNNKLRHSLDSASRNLRHNFYNRNLKYIRALTIGGIDADYDHNIHGKHVAHLVRALPRDCLDSFRILAKTPVPFEIDVLVRSRQRNLQNYVVLWQPRSAKLQDHCLDRHHLDNITRLELLGRVSEDSRFGQTILKQVPRLQELIVHELRSAGRPQLPTILAPWQADSQRPKLQLKSLYVGGVYVQHLVRNGPLGPFLNSAIDLEGLQSLKLEYHAYFPPKDLLLWLAQHVRMNLTTFSLRVGDEPGEALNQFLRSFTGLTTLKIHWARRSAEYNGDLAGVKMHASTLRELNIEDGDGQPSELIIPRPGVECLRDICVNCSNLTHLALRVPPNFVGETHRDQFNEILGYLTSLKNLEVLRLTSIPIFRNPPDAREAASQRYAQQTADLVFAELCDKTRLRVLAITDPLTSLDKDNFGFIRKITLESCGQKVIKASQISFARLRCEEPGTTAFDVWQHPIW
jgi:hypothetical protein